MPNTNQPIIDPLIINPLIVKSYSEKDKSQWRENVKRAIQMIAKYNTNTFDTTSKSLIKLLRLPANRHERIRRCSTRFTQQIMQLRSDKLGVNNTKIRIKRKHPKITPDQHTEHKNKKTKSTKHQSVFEGVTYNQLSHQETEDNLKSRKGNSNIIRMILDNKVTPEKFEQAILSQ